MLSTLLRYADLKARKFVSNRPQLRRLQQYYGFPLGKLLGPNTRVWTEEEVLQWLETRPVTAPAQWRGAARIKHQRKLEQASAENLDQEDSSLA